MRELRFPFVRGRLLLVLFLASAAAAIASFASGCGGPAPEERYFEQVCSMALPRSQEMLETFEAVQLTRAAPGREARVTLLALTLRGTQIARRFRAETRALPLLDTEAGRTADALFESLATTAFETMAREVRRVRSLPESITLFQSIGGLESLELAVLSSYANMRSARAVAAEAELLEFFEKADACKDLEALGTD